MRRALMLAALILFATPLLAHHNVTQISSLVGRDLKLLMGLAQTAIRLPAEIVTSNSTDMNRWVLACE